MAPALTQTMETQICSAGLDAEQASEIEAFENGLKAAKHAAGFSGFGVIGFDEYVDFILNGNPNLETE